MPLIAQIPISIMSLNDWGKQFNCIFIANDRGEDIEKGKWFSQRKSGTVSGGYTDKFEVRIRKKPLSKEEATRQKMSMTKSKEYATVEMTLWQEDMRLKDGYKSIRCSRHHVNDNNGKRE